MHSSILTVFGIFCAAVRVSAADPFEFDYGYGDADEYEYGYGLPYSPPRTVTAPANTVTLDPATTTAYLPTTTYLPTTITATANFTRTYTTTSLAYSACYTTVYDWICDTGICHKTHTITEHCATACPTVRPTSYIPKGFTTTVTVCKNCGPQPTTMTLTYCPTVLPTHKPETPTYSATVIHTSPSLSYSYSTIPSATPCYNCTVSPTMSQVPKPPMNTTSVRPVLPTYTGGATIVGANGAAAAGLMALAAFFL